LFPSKHSNTYSQNCSPVRDRLIFFNSDETSGGQSTTKENKLWWSARGKPLDFRADGAGSEDLVDMRGPGVGMVAEEDRLVLFTTKDIWVATPRRDAFAFDFRQLERDLGADFPRTITATPEGIFWLGAGLNVYRLRGNRVSKLVGSNIHLGLRERLVGFRDSPFGVYNKQRNTFMLFHSSSATLTADSAYELKLDTIRPVNDGEDLGVWEFHTYNKNFMSGAAVSAVSSDYGRTPVMLGAAAAGLWFPWSAQTNDDGSTFTATYRLPAIASQTFQGKTAINEVWLDTASQQNVFRSNSTSTTQIWTSSDNAGSFTNQGNISTSSITATEFLPVNTQASRRPTMELRINDGSRPYISRVALKTLEYEGRF